ncbi:hypothetical protein LMG28614_02257 [Paraburkholderia ultramafica]|uniref:DUF3240 domain-containing protein n=1 Tax=Paraburkholderia ultramafica TaxID=1544867 RepID=A0A6S7BEP5_9BURK|nr:DUF3240 family protein [Paraburkholderia ultramafica]CAB3786221.1 hypothetical protein LMG28614_02257 [Paraburkholderia ultramafica]
MIDCCLNIFAPSGLEERVLDALLAMEGTAILVSSPAYAHGFAHGTLSTTEQVSGRSSATVIQLLIPESRLALITSGLQQELGRSDLRYWATAVTHAGEFK